MNYLANSAVAIVPMIMRDFMYTGSRDYIAND